MLGHRSQGLPERRDPRARPLRLVLADPTLELGARDLRPVQERQLADQQLVEHDTQREHVGAGIDLTPEAARIAERGEGLTVHVLHHQERRVVGESAGVQHAGHARVLRARERAALQLEAGAMELATRMTDDLDGDARANRLGLGSQVHVPHAPRAQGSLDPMAAAARRRPRAKLASAAACSGWRAINSAMRRARSSASASSAARACDSRSKGRDG